MNILTLDANRRLAVALGWTEIVEVGGALLGRPTWACDNSRNQVKVPNWAGDWKDCGPLLAEHRISTEQTGITARAAMESRSVRVKVESEDERDAKTRHAIVSVLCTRLEMRARLAGWS